MPFKKKWVSLQSKNIAMLFQKNIIKKYLALLEPEYNLITE